MASSSKGASRKRLARVRGQRGKKGSRKTKVTILILVQGEVTEKEYFKRLAEVRNWKTSVSVTVYANPQSPDIMVKQAVKQYGDYDLTFVVTDVDKFSPTQFETARSLANRPGNRDKLKIVVTFPKFELWLIAHYEQVKSNCDDAWVTKREQKLEILKPPPGGSKRHRRKHVPKNFPFKDVDRATNNVNLGDYGYWNEQGSTSIPRMIEEIDKLNTDPSS